MLRWIIASVCVIISTSIGLGVKYYIERYADSVNQLEKFKEEVVDETVKKITTIDRYSESLGFSYTEIQGDIREVLVELRLLTGSGWSVAVAVHNGSMMGDYSLKKLTIVDESKKRYLKSQFGRLNGVSISAFDNLRVYKQNPDSLFSERPRDLEFQYAQDNLADFGVSYVVSYPIYLSRYDNESDRSMPAAFIGVYYETEEQAQRFENDLTYKREVHSELIYASQRIERILNRKYNSVR